MSVLRRFNFRCNGCSKKILIGAHPADLPFLETADKAYLIGEAKSLDYYHKNSSTLEEADFVIVLGKKEESLPELLLNLAPEICRCEPNGELADLVLKMHEKTPRDEQALLWQRYFHALAQATPDAQNVFRRMAQNMGVLPPVFTERKYVPTNHFKVGTGTVINWTDPPRGHNYVGFLK
jgi:hypothetical protein